MECLFWLLLFFIECMFSFCKLATSCERLNPGKKPWPFLSFSRRLLFYLVWISTWRINCRQAFFTVRSCVFAAFTALFFPAYWTVRFFWSRINKKGEEIETTVTVGLRMWTTFFSVFHASYHCPGRKLRLWTSYVPRWVSWEKKVGVYEDIREIY